MQTCGKLSCMYMLTWCTSSIPPKKIAGEFMRNPTCSGLETSTQHIVPSCSFRSQLHFVSIIPSTFSASEKTRFLMKFSVFYKDRSVPPKKRQPSDPDFVKGALVLSIDVPTGVIYTRYTWCLKRKHTINSEFKQLQQKMQVFLAATSWCSCSCVVVYHVKICKNKKH